MNARNRKEAWDIADKLMPMSVGRFCKSNRNDLVKVLVMEVETGEIYMSGLISDINENYPDYLSPYLTANPYMLEVKSWEFRPNAGELWLLVHAANC